MDWNPILNWKLLKGSHEFPGPDGGTCINEAAIVAAGFKYKKIENAHDCPPSFSRPIAAYAIALNDRMSDDLRQELLMPFVTRLAGTADTRAVERRRAEYISVQTVKRILPIALRAVKLEKHANRCEAAETVKEAKKAAAAYAAAANAATAANAVDAAANAVDAAANAVDAVDAAVDAAVNAAANAAAYAAAAVAQRQVFTIAAAILDEAIRLGKQAEPIETALVIQRMESIKRVRELTN